MTKNGFNASLRARKEEMSGLVYRVHAVPETVNDFLFDFGAAASTRMNMATRRPHVYNEV